MKSCIGVLCAILLGIFITACQPALTLDKAASLSEKGDALTWSDFDGYRCSETGSGLYIRVYNIDEDYAVWIGGGSAEEAPMYIRLVKNDDLDAYVDMRTGDVAAFLEEHGAQ